MTNKPIQKILFGSPGTGKSHRIKNKYAVNLEIEINSENYVPTVFHPEYTYGDFMGKLMPLTNEKGTVEYKFYAGHFLKALGMAYKNLISASLQYEKAKKEVLDKFKKEISITRQDEFTTEHIIELEKRYALISRKIQNVLLVIDEINRGNSAAVFGTVFQLLDRKNTGWSDYPIALSDLETKTLLKELGLHQEERSGNTRYIRKESSNSKEEILEEKEYKAILESITFGLDDKDKFDLNRNYIKIPPNLSLLATMNTSDNSIYFMDNAFKRRWDWEFVDVDDDDQRESVANRKVMLYGIEKCTWVELVGKLNEYIRSKHKDIRKIEDKQIGYRFINEETITEEHLKNKLMFFLWDSVFGNNKKPLADLLGVAESEIVTFGQFTRKEQVENFVDKILTR